MVLLGYNPEEEISTSESESVVSAMTDHNNFGNAQRSTPGPAQYTQTSQISPFAPPPLRIEIFDGKRDPEFIDNWFMMLKQYFSGFPLDTAEIHKIKYAANFMSKSAYTWYMSSYREDAREGSFDEFEELLREAFYPLDYINTLTRKWLDLRQTGSAAEYVNQYREILRLLPPNGAEAELQKFIDGLKPHLRSRMAEDRPENLKTCMTRAIRLDELRSSYQERERQRQSPHRFPRTNFNKNEGRRGNQYRYNNYGDRRIDADGDTEMSVAALAPGKRLNWKELNLLKREGRCFHCHEKGHNKQNCPKANQY